LPSRAGALSGASRKLDVDQAMVSRQIEGAFGGGFSIVGIPLLSIVMNPVTAGGLLAPLFIAMDLFALRYWKPSKPEFDSGRGDCGDRNGMAGAYAPGSLLFYFC